ncbi:MAG: polysaccharide biosynthesis tyrosine autokinase [Lachnospiraceae bacterium]|nr:polysaccharide biosynthesis tyrosine autokinase [Lachnospiraceae bacterium]
MSEMQETSRQRSDELEKIDLTDLMLDFIHGIKRLWWLVVGLAVLFGAVSYFRVSSSYVPRYVASSTMAVQAVGGSSYINEETAEQMAEVFPYILSSGVLKDVVAKDLGMAYVPGSISATSEKGTNFFTVSVSASDPQQAYDVLQSVIENYPQVAKFVIGNISLTVLDETGVPEDTGRETTIRGSAKRGAAIGAAIGMAILVLYVLTRKTIKSRKEIKKHINLEDYGSVPFVQEKKRKKKQAAHNDLNLLNERVPQSYMEALRKLWIKVMKEMETKGYKTLLVTSSVPGEGKTTLAVNLAIAIAKQGKRVVLVDCDPRNPSVAGCLNNVKERPSLGDILQSKVNPLAALETVDVGGQGKLSVLYGGKAAEKDAKLLGTKAMQTLIQTLESRADIVILDTAPADLLADASNLARFVEAALYVVKYDHTKVRHIRGGVQALSMSGIHILGYVFNADKSARNRSYGYGYGAYGNYGHYGRSSRVGQRADDSGRVVKD